MLELPKLTVCAFIAGLSFAGGWIAHQASQAPVPAPDQEPPAQASKQIRPGKSLGVSRARSYNQPECSAASEERLAELSAQNAKLQRELGICHSHEVAWPEELPPGWAASDFQSTVVQMLDQLGIDGDVEFHCDEFPCIAKFADEVSLKDLKALAAEKFGTSETTHLDVHSHGIVGAYGRQRLLFISAAPAEQMDEFALERTDERISKLVQATKSEMKRAATEAPVEADK